MIIIFSLCACAQHLEDGVKRNVIRSLVGDLSFPADELEELFGVFKVTFCFYASLYETCKLRCSQMQSIGQT